MKKLAILALVAGALVGCVSGGPASNNTTYANTGQCYSYGSYDYSNTGLGGCGIGYRWH